MDCLTQNRTTADGPNPAVAAGLGPATECMSFTWAIATLGRRGRRHPRRHHRVTLAALKPNATIQAAAIPLGIPPIRDVPGPHGK